MTRNDATKLCRDELDKAGLNDWHIRLTTNNQNFLGMCSYKDKCIILNAFHLDTHPDPEIVNTIKHEIAHALCPGQAHNDVWAAKARELGCTSVGPCSHLSLDPAIIDAIRSGATLEVTYETEIIHKPKYQVTRLQDKCEFCGKVAKEVKSSLIVSKDETKPDRKFIWLECGHLIVKHIPKGTAFASLVSNWWKPDIAACKHEFVKNQCKHCAEYKPFNFQVEGMQFAEAALSINKGAAIFDEMGLGKTIQGVGYLRFKPECCPVLILTKKKAKFQWFKEILRWCGPEYLAQVFQTSNDYIIPNLKCYISSYDMFVFKTRKNKRTGKTINQGFDINRLIAAGIKTVILDECQQIKNPDASRTQEVRKIAKHCNVIALSGTPWKNRGSEFFTVLNMLAPMKFPSYEGFLNKWVDFYYDGKYQKQGGIKDVKKFKEYIKDIAIRREVSDVAIEMPDVNRTLAYTELDNLAQNTYEDEVSAFVKWYNDKVIGGEEDDALVSGNILAKLARMRHITGLAKIPATEEFVEEFLEESGKSKICIFVHHKDVGEILYSSLQKKYPNIPVLKFTADMSDMESFKVQERFNKEPTAIGVLSTLAAMEAINLQTCGDAVLHERQWNPQNEDQAAPGRFRRIGASHKLINVTFMTAAGTVDEILAGIVERKRAAFHNTMNKGEMPVWNERSLAKELAEGIVQDWNRKNSGKKSIKEMATL